MGRSKPGRLRAAVEAKRKEIIDLFESMGHTKLSCGTKINTLTLTELQDLYKRGIRK